MEIFLPIKTIHNTSTHSFPSKINLASVCNKFKVGEKEYLLCKGCRKFYEKIFHTIKEKDIEIPLCKNCTPNDIKINFNIKN